MKLNGSQKWLHTAVRNVKLQCCQRFRTLNKIIVYAISPYNEQKSFVLQYGGRAKRETWHTVMTFFAPIL
jgi:hypothetical protein